MSKICKFSVNYCDIAILIPIEYNEWAYELATRTQLKLNIDSYLDGETYENKVKIRLSDFISRRLDGKTIQIKHRGKVITRKIKYKKQPFEIILK